MSLATTAPEDQNDPFHPQELDLFHLLCQRRGWDPETFEAIENPEHDKLKDLDLMVAALHQIRTEGQKIVIAPDFDMDGISSGVLGYAGLAEMGFDVELHIPDYERGHELSPEDIHEIHAQWPTTAALLTCDGGVNSHQGIAAARELGWTTLVTDHHEELPPGSCADVTVDPHRMDETYSHPGICGAHVLYQVLEAYAREHCSHKTWEIRNLRLFAGIGTVSDVMPILFENRQLVRDSISLARLLWAEPPAPYGPGSEDPSKIDVEEATLLQMLRIDQHHPVYLRAFEGFAILLKAFTQTKKIRDYSSFDEGLYGFYLAPAMNAPRRIRAPLTECFEVFTAATPERMLEAAETIIERNELRKQMVAEHRAAIEQSMQPLAPWVYFSDAPKGMFGLLANQLMREHGHPVVVLGTPSLTGGPVSGSARAPEWFDVIDTLTPLDGLSAIGHQQACGVSARDTAALLTLIDVLEEATTAARLAIPENQRHGDLVLGPEKSCDAKLTEQERLTELVRRVQGLRPFGEAFAQPVFELVVSPLHLRVDRIGSESQHLRLVPREGPVMLWWNAAEARGDLLRQVAEQTTRWDAHMLRFTAKLQVNTFRGVERLQAIIEDLIEMPAIIEPANDPEGP